MPSVSTQTTTFMPKCVPVLQKKQISKKFFASMKRIHAGVGKQVELSRREIAKEKRNYLKIVKSSITAFNKRKSAAVKAAKELAKAAKEQEKADRKVAKEAAKLAKEAAKAAEPPRAFRAWRVTTKTIKADREKQAALEAANKAVDEAIEEIKAQIEAAEERQPEEIAVVAKKAKKSKKSKTIVLLE